jgi:hypothetical protein
MQSRFDMTRSSATGVCQRRSRAQLAAILALLVFGAAPLAFAQTPAPTSTTTPTKTPPGKKPKKGAKPAAAASASATAEPAPEPPSPPPAPEPAPVVAVSVETTDTTASAEPEANPSAMTYTKEDPAKKYYFVGLRYRGTIIPQFMENLFVNDGATIYSNTIGAELDMRQDGKSLIPWIAVTTYSTGNILFLQKGKDPTDPDQYSIVNSGLWSIYVGIDELWSMPIADHLDFEYGFGVGVGYVGGSLQNDWVFPATAATPGALRASTGAYYQPCQSQLEGTSCQPAYHQNSTVAKVGGYIEPNWFQGGSVPVIFPHIAIPQFSLRYKPIKQVESRLSLGFSLTGFWFGLSVDYGLEKNDKADTDKGKPKDKDKPADKGNEKKNDTGDQDKKSDGSLDWRDTL